MEERAEPGGSGATLLGVAAAIATLLIALGVYLGFTWDAEVPEQPAVAVATPEDDAAAVKQPPATTAETGETEEPASAATADQTPSAPSKDADLATVEPVPPQPPTIDEVRIESDGLAVIAGRAAPGSTVRVLLDGTENTSVTAGADGAFAAVTTIAPSSDAQVLSLLQGDGSETVTSVDEVILAPFDEPAESSDIVAETETAAGTAAGSETVDIAALAPKPEASAQPAAEDAAAQEPDSSLQRDSETPEDSTAKIDPATGAEPQGEVAQTARQQDEAESTKAPAQRLDSAQDAEAQSKETDQSPVEEEGQIAGEAGQSTDIVAQADPVAEPAPVEDRPATGEVTAMEPTTQTQLTTDAMAPVSTETAEGPGNGEAIAAAPQELEGTEAEPPPSVAAGDASKPETETIASGAAGSEVPSESTVGATPEAEVVAESETPAPATDVASSGEAGQQVAVLKNTAEGVELLTPGPDVMDNVALDTISYSEGGEVQLAGRAQGNATAVRVYLDNAPVATLQVNPDGRWRGDLPEIDTGIYELRVDEIDTTGAVTSRVVTPFKREDPEVLAAAAATSGAEASRIVQKGDSLWRISRQRYGEGYSWVRIYRANRSQIRDPDLIYPGQIFELPE